MRMVQASGKAAEAVFVAKEINRLVGGVDMLEAQEQRADQEKRKLRSFGEIAVLCRTHRQMDRLEKTLRQEGIPYVAAGRGSFLEDPKVRGTCAFFRYLAKGAEADRHMAAELLLDRENNPLTETVLEHLEENFRPLMAKGKPAKFWINGWRSRIWQKIQPCFSSGGRQCSAGIWRNCWKTWPPGRRETCSGAAEKPTGGTRCGL